MKCFINITFIKCRDTPLINTTLFYQAFSVYALYSANTQLSGRTDYLKKRKVERSYYIKALLTYTQLMSILYISNPQIYKALGIATQIGNPSSLIVYGTQCSLKAIGIDHSDFIYFQTYAIMITPILQLFGIIVIIYLASKIKKTIPVAKISGVAAVYFMISYQPGIVSNLTQFLACKTLPGFDHFYIASHPNWVCDSQHVYTSNYFALPGLIIWCGVMPIATLLLLVTKRKSLNSQAVATLFGMLFFDFQDKYYFWGIILMVLKLVLAFLVYGLERSSELHVFAYLYGAIKV